MGQGQGHSTLNPWTISPLVTYDERKLTNCLPSDDPPHSHNPPLFILSPSDILNKYVPPFFNARRKLKPAEYSWNNLYRSNTQCHGPCLLFRPVICISNYISTHLRYAMAERSHDPSICSITSSHHWFGGHRPVNYNLYYNIIARSIIFPLRPSTIITYSASAYSVLRSILLIITSI